MKDTMKLPNWPSHVQKNDGWIYIGRGFYNGGMPINGSLAVALFPFEKIINPEMSSKNLSGTAESMYYFVKKGEPFLARFAPRKPAYSPPLPKGAVYIGKGGECHSSWSFSAEKICFFEFYYYGYTSVWREHNGWSSSDHVAAKIDSPLHKAQPWYVPNSKKEPKKPRETHKEKDARITALNNEVYALKAKLAECERWIKSAPKV